MISFDSRGLEARILSLARYSPELLPPCFDSLEFQCETCWIDDKDTCILLHDPDFLSLLRWKVSNLSRVAENVELDDLVVVLLEVFESQGSALHVDKILGLLRRQNTELKMGSAQLKRVLKDNPELFKEMDANVFLLNSDLGEQRET